MSLPRAPTHMKSGQYRWHASAPSNAPISSPSSPLKSCIPISQPQSKTAFPSLFTNQGDTKPASDMLLKAVSSLSFLPLYDAAAIGSAKAAPVLSVRIPHARKVGGGALVAQATSDKNKVITGVIFEPFEEVKSTLALVPQEIDKSLARHKYLDECEAALNEQINVEYNVSYVYHAMFAYFDRDNVALKGLAKFFKESSEEERDHAEKLMIYQNKRGGRVKLNSIVMPLTEFDHAEKGDALYAMELALALEKLVNEKLLALHRVAEKANDPQMTDYIEGEFLEEQVEAIKKISEYVAQLRRVGKGHGVWHFDQALLHGEAA